MKNLKLIANTNCAFAAHIPEKLRNRNIYQSDGLIKHIQKKHPNCVQYLSQLASILSCPDYIGVNPNETDPSFELVKVFSENIQVGIKLDIKNDYLYVASIYDITDAKLQKNILSGRLTKL